MLVANFLLFLSVSPALYLIYTNTQLNPMFFIIGCGTCLLIELLLLTSYCIFKLQQTFRQSFSINLHPNVKLDPESEYPFVEHVEVEKFYFNKYTEEARVFDKRNSIKLANIEDYYYEEAEVDEEPRRKAMLFLKQIRGYYKILNQFNNALVNFGKNLNAIEKQGIFNNQKFTFSEFQSHFPSEVMHEELLNEEREVLFQTKTKLKIRKDTQRLIFPNWISILNSLKFVGKEFEKIEEMQQSNSEMLGMIHKKVLEDYELIEDKIKTLGKQLEETVKNKESLKKDYEKYQVEEMTENMQANQPHVEMMYWLRRKIYEFKDLERRIRENDSNFKDQTRKLKYYKEKLASFSDLNKKKYLKIVKTRFIAFMDSYHITINESIKKFHSIFNENPVCQTLRHPKVNKLKKYKNMNEALEAEKIYQKEYFERVDFYRQKLSLIIDSVRSLGEFLGRIEQTFVGIVKNLQENKKKQEKEMKYFNKFFRLMNEKCSTFEKEMCKLMEANEKVRIWNEPSLLKIQSSLESKLVEAKQILGAIDIEEGPILYKYKSTKIKLEMLYKEMEECIVKIVEFESLFLVHSSRIKKIMLISLLNFLKFQKELLKFEQINERNFSENEYDMGEEIMEMTSNENNHRDEVSLEFEEKGETLHTGFSLTENYLKLLNRFLFVAFTEWKNSQFFKKTLTEELFIMFNSEPNEKFSRIDISDMEFSGAPPEIVWVKELKSEEHESFLDLHLSFKGKWEFKIATEYQIFARRVSVKVKIEVEEFYCVMRFCFVPAKIGWGWFSFIGEPITKFKVIPSIGEYRIEMETLKNMFHNLLMGKLKKITYPIKQKIPIPLSKKNDDLDLIERRFKNMENQNLLD